MSFSPRTALWSIALVTTLTSDVLSDEVSIPTDCIGLKDGLYYVKPTEDGPVMPAMCNNGYTTIDLSLNIDSVSSYFTSFTKAMPMYDEHTYIYSPGCDLPNELTSWHNWWIPASSDSIESKQSDFTSYTHEMSKFAVAPECTQCKESLSYGDNTAYYMSSYYFCYNKHHTNDCKKYNVVTGENRDASDLYYDLDDSSASMCNLCDDDSVRSNGENAIGWTDCMSIQLDASVSTDTSHDSCVNSNKYIVKPSINDAGKQCVCYKPQSKLSTTYNTIIYDNKKRLYDEILPSVSKNKMQYLMKNKLHIDPLIRFVEDDIETENEEEESYTKKKEKCLRKQYHLSKRDFEQGTLRILECGTYILQDDILLHFGKPSNKQLNDPDWSPNDWNMDELPWHAPTTMQDYYQGASDLTGVYHAGYFTGIAIETDHVVIDLNGYTLEMDPIYYLQQRFFSLIELGNKPFVGDQGPDNFGRMQYTYVNDITIKNGVLGLSSHQGIHGNGAKHVQISDVKVKNFDVSGIQCNGCKDVQIIDTVVGPQKSDIPVLGKYAHCRALMPKLKYIAENYYDEKVTFNNERTVTMGELVDEMVSQMDMIYNYVIHKIEPDESESDRWEAAKRIFLNPTGYQDGGSSYGIILNGIGTAVVQYGKRHESAEDATLQNVEIYGIQNAPLERMWARYQSERQFQGFFFDPLDWMNIVELEDENRMHYYKGDVYHDLIFAAQHIAMEDEFCLLNTINLSKLRNWVFNNNVEDFEKVLFACGSDVQSHDAKGVIGLRVDGTQGLKMKNVHIHDIYNYAPAGIRDDYFCPNGYDAIQFLTAKPSIEPGYTGTRAHGFIMTYAKVESIENLKITSVESQYGTAIGASLYQGSELITVKNVEINKITAGTAYDSNSIKELQSPNMLPRACSFEVGTSDVKEEPVLAESLLIDEKSMSGKEIFGYDLCKEDERLGSMKSRLSAEDIVENEIEIENNEKEFIKEETSKDNEHKKHVWYQVSGVVKKVVVIGAAVVLLFILCYAGIYCMKGKLYKDAVGSESKPLLTNENSRYVLL